MKVRTTRSRIKDVAARWRRQYGHGRYGADKLVIADQLDRLDLETATPEEVKQIIGNDSWCGSERCDECGIYADTVIEVGEEPDYESATATLCTGCVERALKEVQGIGA